jgi:hypothetical protein
MSVNRNQGWGFSQASFDYFARFGGTVGASGPGAGPEVVVEYVEMDSVNEIGAPLIHRITRPVTPIGKPWARRQRGAQQLAKIRRKDDTGLRLGTRRFGIGEPLATALPWYEIVEPHPYVPSCHA